MRKIIPLILIISSLILFSGCKKEETSDLIIEKEDSLKNQYLDIPAKGRPKAQKEMDNIFIALSVLKNASYYSSESYGKVEAKKSIKLATQEVKSRRTITPNATFNESISVSSFVKVAEQVYIGENTILKRDAKKVQDSNNVTWENSATKITKAQYSSKYGYSYRDPTRYIINEDTIISDIEVVNNGIGRKYSYKFKLDPSIAPYNYKTSVKTLSGSTTTPKFTSIEMIITFDYKWRISKIETNEVYEINLPALGKVTCYANLIETFRNIDKFVEIEEESIFLKK